MNGLELDTTLFKLLKANSGLIAALNGGVYLRKRPDNSGKQDIVVNTIDVNHEHPATATSNINIHVPDKKIQINGVQQYSADTAKLKSLTDSVLAIINGATITGVSFWAGLETIIKEENINEHYQNIRINWIIY